MKIKDCLFGQVRKINVFPDSMATDLPNNLSSIITNQEIVTWDNATGMNPLCDYFDDVNYIPVNKLSYGEMMKTTYNMGVECVTRLCPGRNSSIEEWDVLVSQDYESEYTREARRFAQWWHIHYLLNRPGVLKYDYLILRQIDTKILDHITAENIREELVYKNHEILHGVTRVPLIYNVKDSNSDLNQLLTTTIASYWYMLNRAAVLVLKDNFYPLAVNELVHYYNKLGYNNLCLGMPGGIMFKLATKQDIDLVQFEKMVVAPNKCRLHDPGDQAEKSHARIERMGL